MGAADLILKLGFDNSTFTRGLTQSRLLGKQFASGISSDISGKLAAAFGGAAIIAATKKTVEYGGRVSDLAKQLNITTDRVQEYDYWLTQNGATTDALTTSFKELAKAKDAALAGDESVMAAFTSTGLQPSDVSQKSVEDLFRHIANTIRTTNFGDDEEVIVNKLLGRGGASMISAFKEDMGGAADEAHRLGIILDNEVVNKLDEAGDALDRIKAQLRGPLGQAGASVATSGGWLTDKFSKFYQMIGALSAASPRKVLGSLFGGETDPAQEEGAMILNDLLGLQAMPTDFKGGGRKRRIADRAAASLSASPEIAEANEVLKLKQQILEVQRKSLTDEERRAAILNEIEIRERGLAALKATQAVLGTNAVKESDLLKNQLEILTLRGGLPKGGMDIDTDPLIRSGNFLGSRDDRPLTKLDIIARHLQSIQQGTRDVYHELREKL